MNIIQIDFASTGEVNNTVYQEIIEPLYDTEALATLQRYACTSQRNTRVLSNTYVQGGPECEIRAKFIHDQIQEITLTYPSICDRGADIVLTSIQNLWKSRRFTALDTIARCLVSILVDGICTKVAMCELERTPSEKWYLQK